MIINKLLEAYRLFNDEVSSTIFLSKAKWYFQGGEDETTDYLYELYDTSRILGLEKYPKDYEYVVCGAGNYGRKTIKALKHAGYKVRCVLDNDRKKWGGGRP
jgi:Na+-transporting NADH:ubiquinone oxidoreductase subunit NqrF